MLGYFIGIFAKTFNFKEKRTILSMNQSHVYSAIFNECKLRKADNRQGKTHLRVCNGIVNISMQ